MLRATFLIFGKFAQVFPPWFRQRKNERKACKKGKNPKNRVFYQRYYCFPTFFCCKIKKRILLQRVSKKTYPEIFCTVFDTLIWIFARKSCIIIIPTPEYMNKTYLSIFQVLSNLIVTLQKTHIHTTLYSHNIIIISDDLVIKYFPLAIVKQKTYQNKKTNDRQ